MTKKLKPKKKFVPDPSSGGQARWAKPKWRTAKARTAFMRYMESQRKTHAGGRPRVTERCPCGEMTKARAERRNHRCTGAGKPAAVKRIAKPLPSPRPARYPTG